MEQLSSRHQKRLYKKLRLNSPMTLLANPTRLCRSYPKQQSPARKLMDSPHQKMLIYPRFKNTI